jgi:GNAT superfamily N-acetyltransferase
VIVPASSEHLPAVRVLLEEYSKWLGEGHICLQNLNSALGDYRAELEGLPGPYGPPSGALLVAIGRDAIAGCVALRKLDENTCEMKRLFLRPAFRGSGLGKQLAQAIIEEGRKLGYARMRLDSMPGMMDSAIRVYESLGFYDIPPYPANPIPGARHLELALK